VIKHQKNSHRKGKFLYHKKNTCGTPSEGNWEKDMLEEKRKNGTQKMFAAGREGGSILG